MRNAPAALVTAAPPICSGVTWARRSRPRSWAACSPSRCPASCSSSSRASDGKRAREEDGRPQDDPDDQRRVERLPQRVGELGEATPEARAPSPERGPIAVHPGRPVPLESHCSGFSMRPSRRLFGDGSGTIQLRSVVESVTAPCAASHAIAASSAQYTGRHGHRPLTKPVWPPHDVTANVTRSDAAARAGAMACTG